jgi:NitT/TauT family transport system permease protein
MGASMSRMVVAFALSLVFAILYGYFAATNRVAEKILLPILDILQSVPILAFFPVAIIFFVSLTPGSFLGPNFASIFLIFTSMSWNMAFGVYESLKTMPGEIREVADSFDIHGWRRLRVLVFPTTVNRLVYNSILSWSVGLYFLVSAEIFSSGSTSISLPGIGSYLWKYAALGNTDALVTGIVILVLVIIALNFLLWKPLSLWAERYRYDTSPSANPEVGSGRAPFRRISAVAGRAYSAGVSMVKVVSHPLERIGIRRQGDLTHSTTPGEHPPRRHRLAMFFVRYVTLGGLLVVAWLLVIAFGVSIFSIYTQPISAPAMADIKLVPEALLLSSGRVFAAYLISLGIAFPLAMYFFRHARASKVGLPVIQIIAAVPATALFPLFLFGLKDIIGIEAAVIFVLITGMLWYLFFNLLSGLRAIPPDLDEAARSMGLKGTKYFRRLMFPAVFSAFVTGSITAMGGGWNTLIIAEYLPPIGGNTIQVTGLGELIALGVYLPPLGLGNAGYPVLAAAVLTLVVTVVVVNRVIWKPLYRLSTEKYRFD